MTVQVLHLGDVVVEGETWPVLAWAVSVSDGVVLVDTGLIDTTPELEREWGVRVHPWPELGDVVAVINTHLHFDHCGGNRLFPGVPIYVQRAEYEAVAEPSYMVDWVHFPGARYELVEGDAEITPGISVVFVPGHSPGQQAVVVEEPDGRTVLAGDLKYSLAELEGDGDPNVERIRALRPRRVFISHSFEPWNPAVD